MNTTNIPYHRKIGLSFAQHLFLKVNAKSLNYMDLFFMPNEREAIGRRALICLLKAEGYTIREISDYMKCAQSTVISVTNKMKQMNEKDFNKMQKFLRKVYFSQFPKKTYHKGRSMIAKGTFKMLGLEDKPKKVEDKKVIIST